MRLNAKLLCKTADEDTKEKLIEKDKNEDYGMEAIFDLHNIRSELITVERIRSFASDLFDKISMEKGPAFTWGTDSNKEEMKNPKAMGISHLQFVHSSSITMHCLDKIGKVFINIFSCKSFDDKIARDFVIKTWGGDIVSEHVITRK